MSPSDTGRDGVLRTLCEVKDMVRGHHGCFRLCLRETGIDFDIFLPVAQDIRRYHGATVKPYSACGRRGYEDTDRAGGYDVSYL